MRDLWTYSSRSVHAVWGAIDLTRGATDGDFIRLTPPPNYWRTIQGCDGEFARIRPTALPWRVDVEILQSSRTNAELVAATVFDLQTALNASQLIVSDLSSRNGLQFRASVAHVETHEPFVYAGRSAPTVRWTLFCPFATVIALPV